MPKSSANTITMLRQLAVLSPGGRMALPEVFRLMGDLVSSEFMAMYWHDANHNVVDFTPSGPIELSVLMDFLENFAPYEELQRAAGMLPRECYQAGLNIYHSTRSRDFDYHALKKSEFYNRILKSIGFGQSSGVLCRRSDGTPLGGIGIGRPLDGRGFSKQDLLHLSHAQHWIEHLLHRDFKPAVGELHVADGTTGLLILDAAGKALSTSPGALELLYQAADASYTTDGLRRNLQGDVAHILRRIAFPVAAAANGLPALPPALSLNNRWGRFQLRAYAMNAFETGVPLQISLYIEKQVPVTLRLFQAPRFLALSPRQREVALHILDGRSYTEIAGQMGVKPSTVTYFTRQLYMKLHISRQSELLPALLEEMEPAA